MANHSSVESGKGLRLVIGNKNYSSWSLRPWILMHHAGLAFEEIRVPLFTAEGEAMLEQWSPSRKVPVLYDGPLVLWDSLAICEYIADRDAARQFWPAEPAARARARAISAEMHSGFAAVRSRMPMNCRRIVEHFEPDLDTRIDINRLVQIFEQALADSNGPWLFGNYSVADAMYAPIAWRFHTYRITTPRRTTQYLQRVRDDEPMQRWYSDAVAETETIDKAELP